MSTPNQQRSRYPRPLKATHSFTSSGEPTTTTTTVNNGAPSGSGGAVSGTGNSSCLSSPPSPGPRSDAPGFLPSANGSCEVISVCTSSTPPASPSTTGSARRDHFGGTHTDGPLDVADDGGGENPRRSSSMDCLSDPDLWPQSLSSTNQDTDSDSSGFSHKRSNSLSSADRLPKTPPLKGSNVSAVHTRTSIEGLNQEVSSALEGKQIMPSQHPDGHRAPIRDLVGRPSFGPPTPPHNLGLTNHAPNCSPYPSSPSPSPYSPHPSSPHPSSPSQASHSNTSFNETSDTPTGHPSSHSRESPCTPDNAHHHPSSPKPSFYHEPPDGAERCIIKQELKYTSDHIPKGPDKSKASIVFQGSGSAFAPLPSLKAIGGVQC